jgi:hypothetical protein
MGEYIESGELSIADGDSLSFLSRIIPDFRFGNTTENADITLIIKGVDYPLNTATIRSTSTITDSTEQNHVRVRAREIVLRLDGNGVGYGWTMGDFRFGMRTDGRRG